jgi:hypothetical protein
MKITQLLIEQQKARGQSLCESVCHDLTKEQRRIVEGIYKTFEPLMEVALTADQIQQVFQQVDQAKGNRTLIGKGVDVASQVNDAVNKVGTWLQNTTPVQGFDAKFEQLKQSVRSKMGEDNKIIQGIDRLGQLAKDNPGKTAAIIGVLTTIASLAGTPAAGAVVGGILRGTTELLKGEKLSTTIGKGLKGAAYGWMIGKSLQEIGGLLRDGISFVADKIFPGVTHCTQIVNGTMVWDVTLKDADVKTLSGLQQAASKAMFDNDPNYTNLYNKAADFVTKTVNQPGYYDEIVKNAASAEKFYTAANAAAQVMKGIGAGAQGAVTATAGNDKKQPAQTESRELTESEITNIFSRIERLNNRMLTEGRLEEGIWDDVKSGAGKGLQGIKSLAGKAGSAVAKGATAVGGAVAQGAGKALGAVAQGAAKVGHSMTTKVTGSALQKAWEKAGKPTDSAEIEKFLQTQGVNPQVIKTVFQANKIPVTPTAPVGQDAANDPTVDAMPDVMEPGGNRPEQGAMAQGVQQAQGGQQPQQPAQQQPQPAQGGQPQAQQPQPTQGGQQQPGVTASKLPDVSKLTPEQKKQLLAQIDQRLASLPAPTQQPQPQVQQPAPTQSAQPQVQQPAPVQPPATNVQDQPADLFAEPTATPDLKVSPAPKAGLPTPDEQAKYQEKLKAADQTQNKTTTVGAPTPDEQAKLQAKLKAADQAQNKTKPAPKELAESYKEFKFLVDGIKARI